MRAARSSSGRSVPGGGTASRRTWKSMSNEGSSAHSGGANRNGGGRRRRRRRGMTFPARSMRRRNRAKSGGGSRRVSCRKDDRIAGSFSIVHMSASASLMRRSKRRGRSAMSRRYPPLEGPGEGESGAEGWVDDHIDVDDVAGGGLCVRDGSDGLAPPADRSLDGEGGVREPQVLVELHREIHRHGVVDAGALDRELRVDAEDLVQRGVRLDIDAAGGRAVTELGLVEVPGRDQLLIAEDHLAEVTTLVDDQLEMLVALVVGVLGDDLRAIGVDEGRQVEALGRRQLLRLPEPLVRSCARDVDLS